VKFQGRRSEDPDVNLTSLIDVVFMLLIFFMVSTTFQRETELAVELPEASGSPLQNERKVVEVTIDAEGRYYVNRQEVISTQIESLKAAMTQAAGSETAPQVILSADRKTPHEAVVRAMDAAGQLGFVHLTIATTRPGEGG
jgi:biopolymer transport protein ExbD